MVFKKIYWRKKILFYPFFFDIFGARLPSVNGTWTERFNFESYSCEKILRALFFPAWIFWLHRYAISDSIHQRKCTFFVSFLFVMNFAWFYANNKLHLAWVKCCRKKLFRMTINMLLRKKDSKPQISILLLFLIVSFNGKSLLEIGYS